jgi:hypothetical protein
MVFLSVQLEPYEMTTEAENAFHMAKYASQFEIAWKVTAILFLIPPLLPASVWYAFERVG